MEDLKQLYDAIVDGNAGKAKTVVTGALAEGADPQEVLNKYMIPAMDEVGRRFEANEYFVPELLIAARAMKGALELINPKLVEKGAKPAGRVVIGTVQGDLHDIGKNLIGMMLEGAGFRVVDLGSNVTPERFLAAARGEPRTQDVERALDRTCGKQHLGQEVFVAGEEFADLVHAGNQRLAEQRGWLGAGGERFADRAGEFVAVAVDDSAAHGVEVHDAPPAAGSRPCLS